MLRHVPNAITVTRGALGPVVMVLVLVFHAYTVAFWVFLFAVWTDLADGWAARRIGAVSPGALFLDPLADKLLTDFTWIALAAADRAPGWLALVILTRDLGVGIAWAWASPTGRRWAPRPLGQVSIAFEGTALSVLLFHGPYLDVHWPTVGAVLGEIGLALSLVSLLEYAVGQKAP